MSGTRERLDAAIGSVLFNVSNFPEAAQARLLGQDMTPLRERLTSAVLDALSDPPADEVREALTLTIAKAFPGWNEDTSETMHPGWSEAMRLHAEKRWEEINAECIRQGRAYADAVLASPALTVRSLETVTDVYVQWEYGIRASGDDEPYSDVSEDVDWLIEHFTVGVPGEQIVRRRKAGPWEVRT